MNSEQFGPRHRHSAASGGSNTTLRNKDDFACGAGLEDFFVGARSLGERQLFFDHRAQRAIFKSGEETGMDFSFFRGSESPEREAPSRSTAQHQVPRVNRDLTAIADDNHASFGGE